MTVMEDGKSKQTTIDAKSFLSQGRTMIPVRYVAESMGMKVEWDKKTMTHQFALLYSTSKTPALAKMNNRGLLFRQNSM